MTERFQVDLSGMVDLLSRHLYSGPQVFVRELIQNAVDAVSARLEHAPEAPAFIRLTPGTSEQGLPTLEVTDTGTGLTAAEAAELLATIGRSSKRDPILGLGRDRFIGQFGIGLLASFMVADQIEVISRSEDLRAHPVHWIGYSDGTFTVSELEDTNISVGTTVRLTARSDSQSWFELDTLVPLAKTTLPYFRSTSRLGSRMVLVLLKKPEPGKRSLSRTFRGKCSMPIPLAARKPFRNTARKPSVSFPLDTLISIYRSMELLASLIFSRRPSRLEQGNTGYIRNACCLATA